MQRSLNTLVILTSNQAPSSRVRYLNLIPELCQHNIECSALSYPKGLLERLLLLRKSRKADIVILQKKLLSPLQLWLLRFFSKRLCYDFDDAVYLRQVKDRAEISPGRQRKFRKTVLSSDFIIAGNRLLAAHAEVYNNNISIIPSSVAISDVAIKDHKKVTTKVVIGWVGTPVNLSYLQLLQPQLARLSEQYDIEFRIISSESIDMPGVNIKFIPWSLETQESEIAQFDIGVMPLPDSEHAAGKCGYKALQYMAAAVPAVVSDVGVNHEIVTHGKEGMVCEKIENFHDALEQLINNPSQRQQMGLAARKKVEAHYSIEVVAKQLADTLHSLSQQS